MDQAHSAGLRVWAVIGDVNGTDVSTGEVLADTAKRTYIVQQLMQIAAETGLDGINVDFESIRQETAPQYLQFSEGTVRGGPRPGSGGVGGQFSSPLYKVL